MNRNRFQLTQSKLRHNKTHKTTTKINPAFLSFLFCCFASGYSLFLDPTYADVTTDTLSQPSQEVTLAPATPRTQPGLPIKIFSSNSLLIQASMRQIAVRHPEIPGIALATPAFLDPSHEHIILLMNT
ncbi:MAG: hypothetical protein K1X29_03695 [Bdellovibrionales bacterium]|nr:hypothetical protein [Bdellovibrionales bacterium]